MNNGGESQENGPKRRPSRVRRLSKRLSAYFSFVRIGEPDELTNSQQTNGDAASPATPDGEARPNFFIGWSRDARSRAMSDSDSMRRKQAETTAVNKRSSYGFEMGRKSPDFGSSTRSSHSVVRRVSSLPAATSAPPSTPPPFDRLHLYEKLEQLGEGSYATVYKGISKVNKMYVALKEIRLQEEEGAPFTAIREASLLKQLKHVNIVRLHDIIHTNRNLTLVFEYLHTDLCQHLEKYPDGLNKHNVKLLLFQLLRGLSYIHKRRILHRLDLKALIEGAIFVSKSRLFQRLAPRYAKDFCPLPVLNMGIARDLKPQNLLLSEQGDLKLADFGLARSKTVPSRTYSNEVVTLWYRPPDVLCGSKTYSTSLDVWGVGCIFLEMLTGFPLFPGTKGVEDQLDKIWKVCGSPDDEWYNSYDLFKNGDFGSYPKQEIGSYIQRLREVDGAEEIAEKMIQCHPERRVTCDEALRHSYFSDLPNEVHVLPDSISIFSVKGVCLEKEEPPSREKRSDSDESARSIII